MRQGVENCWLFNGKGRDKNTFRWRHNLAFLRTNQIQSIYR